MYSATAYCQPISSPGLREGGRTGNDMPSENESVCQYAFDLEDLKLIYLQNPAWSRHGLGNYGRPSLVKITLQNSSLGFQTRTFDLACINIVIYTYVYIYIFIFIYLQLYIYTYIHHISMMQIAAVWLMILHLWITLPCFFADVLVFRSLPRDFPLKNPSRQRRGWSS